MRKKMAKKELNKLKDINDSYESKIKKCISTMQNRLLYTMFNTIKSFSSRSKKVKKMAKHSFGNQQQYVFSKWAKEVVLLKELKTISATKIQRQYRRRLGRKQRKAMRKQYTESSITIQSWWRAIQARRLFKKMKYRKLYQSEHIINNLNKIFNKLLLVSFHALRRYAKNNIKLKQHIQMKLGKDCRRYTLWKLFVSDSKRCRYDGATLIEVTDNFNCLVVKYKIVINIITNTINIYRVPGKDMLQDKPTTI